MDVSVAFEGDEPEYEVHAPQIGQKLSYSMFC
jgi:hypothetical protein